MGRPKQFVRSQVLADAAQVFWKRGFRDASLQDLERATGVNKSGLYSEFADKDDLFVATLEHFVESTGALAILAQPPLGWGNVEALLLVSSTCKGQGGCFVTNSVRELSILPARARKLIQEHVAKLREGILRNVAAAGPARLEPEAATDLILHMNTGMALAQNLGKPANFAEQVAGFMKLLKL